MIRAYVSSTYEDLKAYREKATEAIEELDAQVVRMERYTADDRRPLDKCLDDVKICDIYILIVGRRIGWRPPDDPAGTNPDGLSITELEHRQAVACRKPCLVFALGDDQPWESKWEQEVDAVRRFRGRVSETIDFFEADPRDLAMRVSSSFASWRLRNPGGDPIPDILPYRIDREDQTDPLGDAFIASEQQGHRRPIVGVLTTTPNDAPDKFAERFAVIELRRWCDLSEDHEDPKRFYPTWADGPAEQRKRRYFGRLAAELRVDPWNGDDAVLVDPIHKVGTPIVACSSVPHTGWDDQQEAAIRLWLEAWRSFPDLVGRHPLFALLAIELPEPEQGLRRWWPGGDRKRIARQVARLERFVHDECSNVHLLGELSALRRTHALSWIRREVGSYLESHPRKDRRMQIQERLEALLDDRFETRPQCRMKALAPELRSDLDRAIRLDAT